MTNSVFLEFEFLALVLCSIILPIGVYVYALLKKAISRNTVLLLGIVLIVLSGIDIFLLQRVGEMAKHSHPCLTMPFLRRNWPRRSTCCLPSLQVLASICCLIY